MPSERINGEDIPDAVREDVRRKLLNGRIEPPKWYSELEEEPISQKAFDSLYEYSCSIPTLTTIGKVWKSDLNFGLPTDEKVWVICEYVEIGKKDRVGIERRRPVIV